MRNELYKCARCGATASIRIIEEVLDRYWHEFRIPLCAICSESLRLCDRRAWEWFRENAFARVPVDNANLLRTHRWSNRNPRQFKQGGKTILLRQCSRCGRDFAKGLDGSDWYPVYLGAFTVEHLAKHVSELWLKEECPGIRLPGDDIARGIVHS